MHCHIRMLKSIRGYVLPMIVMLWLPSYSAAIPAFARQANAECAACHYQHFPKLNNFGRYFKANGYSLMTDEPLAGDDLSLPPNLNFTFFMRTRYVGSSDANGSWQVPDEAAILVGGRLAEGAGGMVEWGGPLLSAKASFTRDISGINLGTTVFTTDGLGAGYGFELMNTGVVRNLRGFERSANSLTGNNSRLEVAGAATGLAVHLATSKWFSALTLFVPDSNEAGISEMDAGGTMSYYVRAAWTPQFTGNDTGLGFGKYGGQSKVTTVDDGSGADAFGNTPGSYKLATNAAFVDAQFQGYLGSHSLAVYLMYAIGDKSAAGTDSVKLWAGTDNRPSAWGLDLEYEMSKGFNLLATSGSFNDGSAGLSAKSLYGLGFYWKIHQNVTLQPMIEYFNGDQGVDANGDAIIRYTMTLETVF